MKTIIMILIHAFIGCTYGQEYNVLTIAKINTIQVRETQEESLILLMGRGPDHVESEINTAGVEENKRVYIYGESYIECWDTFVQSFVIKDESFIFNDNFKVGDSIDVLEQKYPKSYANPVAYYSGFDLNNFAFDKAIWLDLGGGDGIKIFLKLNVIVGFRYANG